MTDDETRLRVREVVAGLSPLSVEIAPDQRLVDDLDFDSLGLLELIAGIEREFDLRPIAEEVGIEAETVGDVEELVLAHAA